MPQIALRVQIIDRRQQSGNPVVILLISVAVTDFPVAVGDKCKRKGLGHLIIGWQFSFEILKPFVKSAVSADLTCSVEHFQIIVAEKQADGDFDIGVIFLKIIHFNGTAASDNADGIKNSGFAGVVFAHENQGVFDIGDLQVVDGLVIADTKFSETRGGQSFLSNMFNM